MPTPAKPFTVLTSEKKSHRTKAELKQRQQGESALATGVALKESPAVKNNAVAHKEFTRINKLLKGIEKNDALYEQIINRYCLILAECAEFEVRKEGFYRDLEELTEDRQLFADADHISAYYKTKNDIQKNILSLDKQLQTKRKMLIDIEKENIMTIASVLRSIPKKPEQNVNPLLEALKGD